jgi:di/tricarboxylate transporter
MFITGCIKPGEAYSRVDWKVYFLIAGLIPLGKAIQNTGLDDLIAGSFVGLTGHFQPLLIIMILFLFTTLLTNLLANNATALLMSPIAISIAIQTGIDPHALLLTVILASSTSFFTPMGYHTLTLMYGPGKYRIKDYLAAGLPLTVVIWIIASLLINYYYITSAGS